MFSRWAYTLSRYVLGNYKTSSECAIISRCCSIKCGGSGENNFKERRRVSGVEIYLTWQIFFPYNLAKGPQQWGKTHCVAWAAVGVTQHGRMCVGVFTVLKIGHAWQTTDKSKVYVYVVSRKGPCECCSDRDWVCTCGMKPRDSVIIRDRQGAELISSSKIDCMFLRRCKWVQCFSGVKKHQ